MPWAKPNLPRKKFARKKIRVSLTVRDRKDTIPILVGIDKKATQWVDFKGRKFAVFFVGDANDIGHITIRRILEDKRTKGVCNVRIEKKKRTYYLQDLEPYSGDKEDRFEYKNAGFVRMIMDEAVNVAKKEGLPLKISVYEPKLKALYRAMGFTFREPSQTGRVVDGTFSYSKVKYWRWNRKFIDLRRRFQKVK